MYLKALLSLQVFHDFNINSMDLRYYDHDWSTWVDVTGQFQLQKKEKFLIGLFTLFKFVFILVMDRAIS